MIRDEIGFTDAAERRGALASLVERRRLANFFSLIARHAFAAVRKPDAFIILP